jgi:hypothetical protein
LRNAGINVHRDQLAAFDVAEIAEYAEPAIRVLNQELIPAVFQRQDPAAGLNHERGCSRSLVKGSPRLGNREPEGLRLGLVVFFFIGPL